MRIYLGKSGFGLMLFTILCFVFFESYLSKESEASTTIGNACETTSAYSACEKNRAQAAAAHASWSAGSGGLSFGIETEFESDGVQMLQALVRNDTSSPILIGPNIYANLLVTTPAKSIEISPGPEACGLCHELLAAGSSAIILSVRTDSPNLRKYVPSGAKYEFKFKFYRATYVTTETLHDDSSLPEPEHFITNGAFAIVP